MQESASPVRTSEVHSDRGRIDTDCIRIFYRVRFRNLFAHIPLSFIPLYVGWTAPSWRVNLLFVALLWVYVLGTLWSTYRFNRSNIPAEKLPRWRTTLYPQYALLGLVYNLIFMHLQYHGIDNSLLYLFLITAGFSAGGVGAFSYIKWLGPTFVSFAIVPQIVFYLFQIVPGTGLLGFAMIIFLLFMTNVCLTMNREAIKTLSLTYQLEEARDKAEHLALTDVLTGLYNRRAFYELGTALLANGQRYKKPLAVIMLDIDHFKRINDHYGHSAGDEAIKMIGDHIRRVVRKSDISARIGGEEFCILLPETGASDAKGLAERLRQVIEDEALEFEGNKIALTSSIGVTEFCPESNTIEKLLRKVDQAMYSAKQGGRNRIALTS